ncbi:hypothetical protein [Streptomyces sp. NPDC047042]|uniref:hypothetical protein n=1 Tax=Streptomyces sp. NPDC047042 TaxID=3154807 RepID=UPI00340A9F71
MLANPAAVIKPVTLELSGKGTNIVPEDADMPKAVDLWPFLIGGGQPAASVARMVERMRTLMVGDPADPATDGRCRSAASSKAASAGSSVRTPSRLHPEEVRHPGRRPVTVGEALRAAVLSTPPQQG